MVFWGEFVCFVVAVGGGGFGWFLFVYVCFFANSDLFLCHKQSTLINPFLVAI